MTTTVYGTLPTSPPPISTTSPSSSSSTRHCRHPWRSLLSPSSISLPRSLPESYLRIRTNLPRFARNYSLLLLFLLFLSLLWHPFSLISFVLLAAGWLLLYFSRDEPIVVLGSVIGDKIVLIVLWIATVVVLLYCDDGVTVNVLVSVGVGVVVVVAHAAVRRVDDLVAVGEEEEKGVGTRL